MKFSLTTCLVIVTFVVLLVSMLNTRQKYRQLREKQEIRNAIVRKEYLSINGQNIPDDRLEEALVKSNRSLRSVARRIAELDNLKMKVGLLKEPVVFLQVRSGAGGGNPNEIDMVGRTSIYVDNVVKSEFPFNPNVDMKEKSTAYFRGGFIPEDKTFVVKKVEFQAVAAGDSNGHGEFIVRLGRQKIVKLRDDPNVTNDAWHGEFEIQPGEENSVMIEVANSSAGQAKFTGEFITRKSGQQ